MNRVLEVFAVLLLLIVVLVLSYVLSAYVLYWIGLAPAQIYIMLGWPVNNE